LKQGLRKVSSYTQPTLKLVIDFEYFIHINKV